MRDLATDYLHFIETTFALHRPVVPLLEDALRRSGARRIVDLCSGGSGPVPALVRELAARGVVVTAVLTDLYPNAPAFDAITTQTGGTVTGEPEPVDAKSVPRELTGFRTVFNAFHHFRSRAAEAVLSDAHAAGMPIGVFEIPQRSLGTFLPLLLTPIIVVLGTPFIRPFRWDRLLWTYLLPLVPLTCWWDGLVSQLRAYEPEELEALTVRLKAGYAWRAGRVPIGHLPGNLTFLIGVPERPLEARTS